MLQNTKHSYVRKHLFKYSIKTKHHCTVNNVKIDRKWKAFNCVQIMKDGFQGNSFVWGLALERSIFTYICLVTKSQEEEHQAPQLLGVFKKLSKDLVP